MLLCTYQVPIDCILVNQRFKKVKLKHLTTTFTEIAFLQKIKDYYLLCLKLSIHECNIYLLKYSPLHLTPRHIRGEKGSLHLAHFPRLVLLRSPPQVDRCADNSIDYEITFSLANYTSNLVKNLELL